MKQVPIFIPLGEIEHIDDAETTPYRRGLVEIKARDRMLKGFACDNLTATYAWGCNGAGKGFSQLLTCRFEGRASHFNHLLCELANRQSTFIVLLPKGDMYTVVGRYFDDIHIQPECNDDMSFVMESCYATVPFPYYDGVVSIDDCDVVELTEHLYGIKTKEECPAGLGNITVMMAEPRTEEEEAEYLRRIEIVYPDDDTSDDEKGDLQFVVLGHARKILEDTSVEQTELQEKALHRAWMELYGSGYRDCRNSVVIDRSGDKVKVIFKSDFIY